MVYYIFEINLQEEMENSDNVQDIFLDQKEIWYDVDMKHLDGNLQASWELYIRRI
jgi:hypothetical protein